MMCKEEQRESWKITVVHGTHNHEIGESVYGHALAGRPTAEEFAVLKKMTLGHCTPIKIASTLNADPKNFTTKKQVYNNMYKVRKERMEGRTVVQDFLYQCQQNDYFIEHKINAETNEITDIFFASPDSISLLKAFPYIIVLDSTYATNR